MGLADVQHPGGRPQGYRQAETGIDMLDYSFDGRIGDFLSSARSFRGMANEISEKLCQITSDQLRGQIVIFLHLVSDPKKQLLYITGILWSVEAFLKELVQLLEQRGADILFRKIDDGSCIGARHISVFMNGSLGDEQNVVIDNRIGLIFDEAFAAAGN